MHDLHFLELAALAELIRTRATSPVEITVHQLDRFTRTKAEPYDQIAGDCCASSRGGSKNGNRIEGRSL
jgi:hypothetical protein